MVKMFLILNFQFHQGDKLMRLPSYSYDKDDLARHLSVAGDGDEEVIEADDYLQPAPPVPLTADNNNHKVWVERIDRVMDGFGG